MANLGQLFPGMTIFAVRPLSRDAQRGPRPRRGRGRRPSGGARDRAAPASLRRGAAHRDPERHVRGLPRSTGRAVRAEPFEPLRDRRPLGLHDLWSLYAIDRPDLKGEGWSPLTPKRLLATATTWATSSPPSARADILLHHPYESFTDSVEVFIAQAADDPKVVGIKQTLYRTSGDSPIVGSLIRAAEHGKQVVALVELKARFDEAANIELGQDPRRLGRARGLRDRRALRRTPRPRSWCAARATRPPATCTSPRVTTTPRPRGNYEDFGMLTCRPGHRARHRRALQLPDRLRAPRRLPPRSS
jgi:hypothetical protein